MLTRNVATFRIHGQDTQTLRPRRIIHATVRPPSRYHAGPHMLESRHSESNKAGGAKKV